MIELFTATSTNKNIASSTTHYPGAGWNWVEDGFDGYKPDPRSQYFSGLSYNNDTGEEIEYYGIIHDTRESKQKIEIGVDDNLFCLFIIVFCLVFFWWFMLKMIKIFQKNDNS